MRFPGRRESISAAMTWASRITSIALEMALPPLFGSWLDRRWGTGYALLIVGGVLGFVLGMMHLVRLAADASPKRATSKPAAARGSAAPAGRPGKRPTPEERSSPDNGVLPP